MTHSAWLNQNYDSIERVAKNVSPTRWRELLTYYCIWLDEKWERFDAIPNNIERIKFTTTWLSDNSKWDNSEFNRDSRVNNLGEIYDVPDVKSDDEYIDISSDVDDGSKDMVLDLLYKYGECRTDRILKVRYIYLNDLSVAERVLYDLYFVKMLSCRKIAVQLNLPTMAAYVMITNLKNKIKQCSN